jgi:sugar phosphate isomerase/epimerase
MRCGHENVKLIAAMEMDGIDIGRFEGRSHLWPSREFKSIARSTRTLAKKLADRGLKPADVFLQMNPDFVPYAINHPQPARRRKARDTFLRTLEYASRLGSPHVTTLPGVYFEKEEAKSDSWQRSLRAITRMSPAEPCYRDLTIDEFRLFNNMLSDESHQM